MMTPVLIGSRALKFWFPEFQLKEDADWDIISESKIGESEWHDPNILYNREFAERYLTRETVAFNGKEIHVMSPMGLALIKRSHLWRDLSFQKHITHYHQYLSKFYSQSTQADTQFLNKRIELTKRLYPKGNPNLMQKKNEFFSDAVTKKYEHDWLHELVAFYDKPLYSRLLRTPELAWCERDKWETFTDTEKVQCVAEETYVIAIERFMVPNEWKFPEKLAYIKSLDKVCTTLCSGWFRDYAIDNYPQLVSVFNKQKFDKVLEKIILTAESDRRYHHE